MNTFLAVALYAVAVIAANLTVSFFGPWVSPINAFFLIGLDLTLRDRLHARVGPVQMLLLIITTGLITWGLNPAAGQIALASACAFTAAALVDWSVFCSLPSRGWAFRCNASNVAGAAIDSLIFPTLAFGVLLPHVVALQFLAKVAGGAVWSALLRPGTAGAAR